MDRHVAESLKEFATPGQWEKLQAIVEHGSERAAAQALGVCRGTINSAVERVRAKAAKRGYSPEHGLVHKIPDGFKLRGASTLHHAEKGQLLQWVKTSEDRERQAELMLEAVKALREEIPPEPPVVYSGHPNTDLLNLYVVTDYHFGMLAWHEETGDDWDLRIAEDLLVRWFRKAIECSPDAEVGYFANIGDLLHFDGLEALTPTSGNVLDADTRFPKLVRCVIRVLRRVIRMLLEKHDAVVVLMAEGNHDLAGSVWLREFFAALYDEEPRVVVEQNSDIYYCYEHGLTSLFFHHGHKRKPANVHDVFAAKYRDVFGRTKYSYGHTGHLHNQQIVESPLMLVEQHRTLASPDAYASRGGWVSGRDAKVITYSKRFGEVSRLTISPEMVR